MLKAKQLGIGKKERRALKWVRNMLATGKLKHIDDREDYPEGSNCFDLGVGQRTYDCGTVACIGGWVYVGMNLDKIEKKGELFMPTKEQTDAAEDYISASQGGLHELFYPSLIDDYHEVTPEEAVTAIDNYLEHGDPKWKKHK